MALFKRTLSVLVALVLTALPIFALWQRQNIIDWWKLRNYLAPAEIAALATDTTMTDNGRRLFYIQRPELNDAATFNENCSGLEHTIILGCYVSNKGIYIFRVEDSRLEGIHQVTAAHEMLHAAYDRLSQSEKERINRLTEDTYSKLNNDRLKKVVASYEAKDPGVVPNELHSILATEVSELPTELELYYKRYFKDRKKVVAYSHRYERVFSRRQETINALSKKIDRLQSELELARTEILQMEASLMTENARLARLKAAGDIDSYNASIPAYNIKVNQYRSRIASFNNKVQQLNDIVRQYNKIATEQRELAEAINSHSKFK